MSFFIGLRIFEKSHSSCEYLKTEIKRIEKEGKVPPHQLNEALAWTISHMLSRQGITMSFQDITSLENWEQHLDRWIHKEAYDFNSAGNFLYYTLKNDDWTLFP